MGCSAFREQDLQRRRCLRQPQGAAHRRTSALECARGSAIVEFAIVAPILIALIVATVQTSIVFFVQQTLETTVETSARMLATGLAQTSGMTGPTFRTAVCKTLPPFFRCDAIVIDVRTIDGFAEARNGLPGLVDAAGKPIAAGSFAPGDAGSIVVMRVLYPFPVVPGPLGFDLSNMSGGKRLLLATTVFRTEPYRQ